MKRGFLVSIFLICVIAGTKAAERRLNNLVSTLADVSSISGANTALKFQRASDGWVFVSTTSSGQGNVMVLIDQQPLTIPEAMRLVVKGEHTLEVQCQGDVRVEKLEVRSIPELIHCGLG